MWSEEPADEYVKEVIKVGIAAAIWIPYFSISSRVHGTFTRRIKTEHKTVIEQDEKINEMTDHETLE